MQSDQEAREPDGPRPSYILLVSTTLAESVIKQTSNIPGFIEALQYPDSRHSSTLASKTSEDNREEFR